MTYLEYCKTALLPEVDWKTHLIQIDDTISIAVYPIDAVGILNDMYGNLYLPENPAVYSYMIYIVYDKAIRFRINKTNPDYDINQLLITNYAFVGYEAEEYLNGLLRDRKMKQYLRSLGK